RIYIRKMKKGCLYHYTFRSAFLQAQKTEAVPPNDRTASDFHKQISFSSRFQSLQVLSVPFPLPCRIPRPSKYGQMHAVSANKIRSSCLRVPGGPDKRQTV